MHRYTVLAGRLCGRRECYICVSSMSLVVRWCALREIIKLTFHPIVMCHLSCLRVT